MNTARWEVRGWMKYAALDDYENGESIDSEDGQITSGSEFFSDPDLAHLVSSLMAFAGVDDPSAVILNSCGEAGRIDIQSMETEDGVPAVLHELESWKRGELRLWSVTYSFYAEWVTHETRALPKIDGYEVEDAEEDSAKA
jgi:hypothetical protein